MAIRLHIERLVMDGTWTPRERSRFLASFEGELQRLFSTSAGSRTSGGAVPSLRPVTAPHAGPDAAAQGAAAAVALFTSLNGERR